MGLGWLSWWWLRLALVALAAGACGVVPLPGRPDLRVGVRKKSNVNPGHYKTAGRERPGEGIVQQIDKGRLARARARTARSRSQAVPGRCIRWVRRRPPPLSGLRVTAHAGEWSPRINPPRSERPHWGRIRAGTDVAPGGGRRTPRRLNRGSRATSRGGGRPRPGARAPRARAPSTSTGKEVESWERASETS